MTLINSKEDLEIDTKDGNINSVLQKCVEMDQLGEIYNKELIQQRERIHKIKKKLHAYNKNIEEQESIFNHFVKCKDGFINQIIHFLESLSYIKSFTFLSDCKKVLQLDDSKEINLETDYSYNPPCYDERLKKGTKRKSRKGYIKDRNREMSYNKTYSYRDEYKNRYRKNRNTRIYSNSSSSSSTSSVNNRYSINNRFNNYNIYNINNSSSRFREPPKKNFRENENIFDLSYPYDTIEIKELYEIYKQKKINLNFQNYCK